MSTECCRVCLDNYNDNLPIDEVFVQAYNMLTNLNVNLNDGLSQHVCIACREVIKSFIEFRNKCVDIEYYQRKFLQEPKPECMENEEIKKENDFNFILSTREETDDQSLNDTCFDDPFDCHDEKKEDLKVAVRRSNRKPKKKVNNTTVPIKIKKENVKEEIDETQLPCGLCTKTFDNITELSNHLETHKNILHCQICQELQAQWYKALAHRSVHIPTKKLNCYICSKQSSTVTSLAIHYRLVHKQSIPSDLQCKVCSHTFKSARYLNRHEKAFHSGNILICDYCSKTVKTKQLMASHLIIHSDLKPVKCELCDFTCKRDLNLKEHKLRKHTAVRVHCKQCNRIFENEDRKEKHMCSQSHHQMCPICGKIVKSRLTRHMLSHGPERNFKCDRCPSDFKTKRGLVEHIDRHDGIKKHSCEYCPMSFYSQVSQAKHRRKHTGERPYGCKKCGKAFRTNYNLKIHMQVHGEYLVKKRDAKESGLLSIKQRMK